MEKTAISWLLSGLRTLGWQQACGCPAGPRRWERGSCRLQQLLWDRGGWLIASLPRVTLLCICDCVCFKHSWTWKLQSREGNKTIFRQIRPQESEEEFIVKHKETCEAHRCSPEGIFEITETDLDVAWQVLEVELGILMNIYLSFYSLYVNRKRLHGFLFLFLTCMLYPHPNSNSSGWNWQTTNLPFLWFGTENFVECHWEVKSQSPLTPPTRHSKLQMVQMTIWLLSHSVP